MILLTMVLTKYALLHSFEYNFISLNRFILLAISIIFTTAAGYVINDIFDIETDLINKPQKTYISKIISLKNGRILYFILTVFAGVIAFSFSIKPIHYVLFFGTPILLFLYSKYFKRTLFVGNLIVSILVPLPIYMVYLIDFIPFKTNVSTFDNPIYYATYFYLVFAFLTTLIREIIKDIEDVNGDLKINAKTLPIVFGRKRTKNVAFFFTVILLIFLILIIRNITYAVIPLIYSLLFLLLPLLYFVCKLWFAKGKKDYSKLSGFMKIIMFFGILSMLLFRII
ncbi:geranylgeranylglycerol-phosphate geranylgeranyltransferase [uncultured Polaribacter sp.]|uniref:geranylgeranylglycerol-phosphate geranylgeranyltransferase n=1 Tax=uncultured Polaribacter sp. TaxID=174711 RepID=UPI0026294146|nr:geranylgeranylglycerol-phosphate geranylgeranyltransferase [uncultured Polaribacter sp.]